MEIDLEQEMMNALGAEIAKEIDQEIIKGMLWEIHMNEHPDWHLVYLKWEKSHDQQYFWNEVCAWVMETFGLPGEKYMSHFTKEHIIFSFKNQEDATLTTLRWA